MLLCYQKHQKTSHLWVRPPRVLRRFQMSMSVPVGQPPKTSCVWPKMVRLRGWGCYVARSHSRKVGECNPQPSCATLCLDSQHLFHRPRSWQNIPSIEGAEFLWPYKIPRHRWKTTTFAASGAEAAQCHWSKWRVDTRLVTTCYYRLSFFVNVMIFMTPNFFWCWNSHVHYIFLGIVVEFAREKNISGHKKPYNLKS